MKNWTITIGLTLCILSISKWNAISVQANNNVVSPNLKTSQAEHPDSFLDDESFEKLKDLSDATRSAEIQITNYKPRSRIRLDDLVIAETSQPHQEIWGFYVDQRKAIYPFGSGISNAKKSLSILPTRTAPEGEILLVLSHISDLRLGLAIPEKIAVVTVYSQEPPEPAENPSTSISFLLEEPEFTQSGEKLKTLKNRFREVYVPNENDPIELTIKGSIYDGNSEELQISMMLLPDLQQVFDTVSGKTSDSFSSSLQIPHPEWNQEMHVIVRIGKNKEEILNADSSSTPKSEMISFQIKPAKNYPTVGKIVWEANNSPMLGILLLLFIASIGYKIVSRNSHDPLLKRFTTGVIFLQILLLSLILAVNTLNGLYEKGLLEIPGGEITILQKEKIQTAQPTITRLNEDLELTSALSTSWSNISPNIWEFTLRNGVSIESIVLQLQRKIQSSSPDRQYLASIKNMISVYPDKLQIMTQFPDPLLPQKLSKVLLDTRVDALRSTEAYLSTQSSANNTRGVLNKHYALLPFLKNPAHYQEIIRHEDTKSIEELIKRKSVDLFDEPDTKLWPVLLQQGYRILPKINTESVMMLVNRKSYFLSDKRAVEALSIILHNPRVLQTSYFQYGQLADQFAPPGVIGYDSELNTETTTPAARSLLDTLQQEKESDEIILTFRYPKKERTLAKVLQRELELAGVSLISTEVANENYERSLMEQSYDLTLLPLDYEIGDIGPFLDALIDAESAFNRTYDNKEVNELIAKSRTQLNSITRLELLQQIMEIIVKDDPAGIPLLFKRSFVAVKEPVETTWWEKLLQRIVLGWR